MPPSTIRLLIADDQNLVRQGLVALLRGVPGIEVVGQASDLEGAKRLVGQMRPDVLLLDATSPDARLLAVIREMQAEYPETHVVAMTDHGPNECVVLNPPPPGGSMQVPRQCCLQQAFAAGARGAVRKTGSREELIHVLRAVHAGQFAIEVEQATRLIDTLSRRRREPALPTLTEREMAIVRHLVDGRSNKEIGGALGIKEQTVKNHVSRILQKLQLADRVQIAVYALRNYLLDGPR